mmetsp:Transcript_5246/g.16172  ORF Transcript_5246/g.16172 Transcript_5246/m.16172 type:complete len:518 (-) Transcript_5246:258-1811(-)
MAQSWLHERLAGLAPGNFGQGILCFCTAGLTPPPGFEDVWNTFDQDGEGWVAPLPQRLEVCSASLVFCNPLSMEQVSILSQLLQLWSTLGASCPPLILVPHVVGVPTECCHDVIAEMMRQGLDDVVIGEPARFHLALAVRMRTRAIEELATAIDKQFCERRACAATAERLSSAIDKILWQYSCRRLASSIPLVDNGIPAGELPALDGYSLGGELGRGAYGKVYALRPVHQPASQRLDNIVNGGHAEPNEVLKTVSKACFQDVEDIVRLNHSVEIMKLLGSQAWQHPNLARLLQVYHTPSHICFRAEYGGPENLNQRLKARDSKGEGHRPLSTSRTSSVVVQALAVLAHLHTGPGVVHRDIKPENLIVKDDDSGIGLKLVDFDFAVLQRGRGQLQGACGTLPFVAPEAVLEPEYRGLPIDVWSLGIMLMEVLCGLHLIDRAAKLKGLTKRTAVAERIRATFQPPGSAGKLLRKHCLEELGAFLPGAEAIVDGMLDVNASTRWPASQALAEARDQLAGL